MNTRIIPALLGALLFSGVAEAAPSIYPVDTARFLGGSRFDFKVEFDGELAEKDAKVLINGQDAKAVLGAKPEFIAKEKGADASALLLRGASLKPGQYKVTVESPTGKASANWDVYGTPAVSVSCDKTSLKPSLNTVLSAKTSLITSLALGGKSANLY